MPPVERRSKATLWALVLAVVVLALAGVRAWRHATAPAAPAAAPAVRYQCPMHPQIVRDQPGYCPICHMRLEKVSVDAAAPAAAPEARRPVKYRDPMDPTVFSDHPMKDSMGMYYIPVYGAAPAPTPAARRPIKYRNPMDPTLFSDHPMKDSMGMDYIPVYADSPAPGAASVPGLAPFNLDARERQLIGVREATVQVMALVRTVRLPGRFAAGGRVEAQLLEIDAGELKAGMPAVLEGPNGHEAAARVLRVADAEDDLTHAFNVELSVPARRPWMRPGVFCLARVFVALGRRLAVPVDAVLDSGERQVAFVVQGDGYFEPRELRLGPAGDRFVTVRSGLKAGERVVVAANFLIDSEAQFRDALARFGGGGHD